MCCVSKHLASIEGKQARGHMLCAGGSAETGSRPSVAPLGQLGHAPSGAAEYPDPVPASAPAASTTGISRHNQQERILMAHQFELSNNHMVNSIYQETETQQAFTCAPGPCRRA